MKFRIGDKVPLEKVIFVDGMNVNLFPNRRNAIVQKIVRHNNKRYYLVRCNVYTLPRT